MPSFKRNKIYYFSYRPKLRERLPFWDRRPLMFPLRTSATRTLGINIHWVPVKLRDRFLNFLMDSSQKIRNERNFARHTYAIIRATPGLRMVAEKGIRMYINRNASNVQEITRDQVLAEGNRRIFGRHKARKVFKR